MKRNSISFITKTHIIIMLLVLSLVACQENKTDDNTQPPEQVLSAQTYTTHWEYIGEFTPDQKNKMESWIEEVYEATQITLGVYPFDVYVSFEATQSSGSRPVSFGLASRREHKNKVHFYVDPTASLEDLLGDWTAPHELSHLAIPFLGQKSKWFTEGFATFLSRQIMMEMGYFTQVEFDSLYRSKIADSKQYYNSKTKTFSAVSDSLMSQHIYGSMYWGGASFFLTLDERLRKEKGMRFIEIMQTYQTCCRMEDENLKEVIRSFDSIINETWCRDLMIRYRKEPASSVMTGY